MTRLAAAGLAAAAALAALPAAAGAATIPVTTGADEFGSGADCSLREAVQSANAGTAFGGCPTGDPGDDTISLTPGRSHTLAIGGTGEDLNATGDLDANTAGGRLTISAGAPGARPAVAAGFPGTSDRLLDVSGNGDLTLTGVTLTGGVAETGAGGAIRWTAPSSGDLDVTDSLVSSNSAEQGGAIDVDTTGVHTIEDSTLSDNFAFDLGTVRSSGELRVLRSALLDNIGGGVIAQKPGADSLLLTDSTVAGNRFGADLSVGGISTEGAATISNSTISGNIGGFVGAIELGGPADISFTTIAENGAPPAGGFAAGAIGTEFPETVTLDGVILSRNQLGQQQSSCGAGVMVVEGPNRNLESSDSCGLDEGAGSLVNTPADLAPLADNGGPTPTRGLYPGSAALDAGLAACTPAADQRGVARPGASAACDLGAFEGTVPRPPPATIPTAPTTVTPSPLQPSSKKCGKKQKRTKSGKCVKRKKKKRSKARALAAEVHERVVLGRSVRGRKIVATRVGDPDGARVALAVGVIHGDERAGLEVLDQISAADLDGVQLWVIPSINPDGQRAGARRNARGVDLNRNFPFRWRGGVPASSGYYPGRAPASEPETKAVMAFIEDVKPQVSVWYHQPWGAVLACRGNPELAARYASLAGMRTSCRGEGLRGTAITWQEDLLPGSQAFVVELGPRGASQGIARRHASALAAIARAQPALGAAADTVARASAAQRPQISKRLIPYGPARQNDMAEYSRRHYGEASSALTDPKLIVIHYAEAGSISSIFNTFAPNRPDVEYKELPGVCSHYAVGSGGEIVRFVPDALRCRHVVGLNHTALGIEHVGFSDGDVLGNKRELKASLRLTQFLRCREGIGIKQVIGHNESLRSPYYVELDPDFRGRTHGDFPTSAMKVYRGALRKLGPC